MSKSFTLGELAEKSSSQLLGNKDHEVTCVNSIESATTTDVSFLANPRYIKELNSTKAGVVCIDEKTTPVEGKNYLISDNPSKTFQIITDLLIPSFFTGFDHIHHSAIIHKTATIDPSAHIGPNVTIDKDVKIGANTRIYPNVYVGPKTQIGNDCVLYSGSIVREGCHLHNRVILQPGAVIGSCGFGYITDKLGQHTKIKQLGSVVLEDDVEIGSNTTIDRARFKNTVIKQGTKIDNLVQIGHNVILGKHNIVVAQTGIAGSSKTGDYVIIGAQVGITGHIEITSQCIVATRSGVSKSLTKKGTYGGTPAVFFNEYNNHRVHIKRLPAYVKRLKELEEKIQELEKQLSS